MKDLKIGPEQFLQPFFNPAENVCVRIFSDQKGDGFKGQKLDIPSAKVAQFVKILEDHNQKNRGIFFVVNYGGHEDKDITRVNAQFVENDKLSLEQQYKRLMAFALEPSLIVKTKKSLHSYWLIKNGDVAKFRDIQIKLARYFDGDRSIVNESRVLRIPGFEHRKNEAVRVECIKYNPELRYTQEELLKCLPIDAIDVNGAQDQPKVTGKHKGIKQVLRRCDFMKHCRENGDQLSEHDWYAMITNLGVLEGGKDVIHQYSKLYPEYSHAETEDKIQHFLESKTKPMTCRTIYDKGYKCAKVESGKCPCKSPASFIYVPMELTELSEALKEQSVKENVSEDMLTAAAFIKDFLYNVEEIIAEPFINNDLKKHFGFKNDCVKILMRKYKETFSGFQRDKKRTAESSFELPAWYEASERGMKFIPGILATHLNKNVPAFYGAEEFYLYDNGVYKDVKNLVVSKIVRERLIDRYATMGGINDALGQWQVLMFKPVNQLNPNPFVINVKNGLYYVLEKKLKPHTADYYSTVQINASYEPTAKCENFKKFISECLDPDEIYLVQEILGYLLIPINKAQKSFVFVGAGNAGKSTLLSVAQEILLGGNNVSNVPWQALADRFKTAELFGKLANIFADLPSKNIDDNGLFKSITGEDYITVEKKNKPPFSFKPYARLLFSCNEIPRNYGDKSAAFYRRLIIIRFDRAVPAEKRDASLREKLSLEADGILMWALEGLLRLVQNDYHFSETEKSKAEIEKYRTECNSVLAFVDEQCEIVEDQFTEAGELYRRYKEYCVESGLNAVSQIRFSKELRGNFTQIMATKDSISRRVIYSGINLI
jgi:putative DNA primase/helicase